MMTTFTWAISHYRSQSSYAGAYMKSATFSSDTLNKILWRLESSTVQDKNRVCMYGVSTDNDNRNNMLTTKVHLRLISPGDNSTVSASYSFWLLNNLRHKIEKRCFALDVFGKYDTGSPYTLPILNEDLLINDMLLLVCEVKPEKQDSPAIDVPPCTIIQDLHSLMKEEILTDVKLRAGEREFSAHRAILSARSKVFAAMFKHKTQEQESGYVEIEDMSSESVKQMLDFIYTGKVENLSTVAELLLPAADKYELDRLKLLCEESLISTLTINNSAKRLIVADFHHAAQLKNCVLTFIRANLSAVVQTEGGKALLRSHPNLVEKLLIAK